MKTPFFDQLWDLLSLTALALTDPRPRPKFVHLALGWLCGQKPKTLTSALAWLDQTQEDWSADYRLFSQAQWDVATIFQPLFTQALAHPACGTQRVYLGQDDTLVRKTGRQIPGVAYARDPLSPPFQVNLVLGQRFVQTSLLLQPGGPAHPWRALPVSFAHAPTPKIPKRASPAEQAVLKEVRKKHRLSLVALEQLHFCRRHLDAQPGGHERWLMDVVDGGYSNRTFLRGLPERTDAVARVRKDAKFRAYLPPDQRRGARKYGPALPTPLACLQDPLLAWQSTEVFVAGKVRALHYKEMPLLCWPKVTQARPMRLLLIKAAGYRLRKGSKLLYREPAFLITTDLTTPAVELIAAYLARWEVEVNFRDEKSLLGVGQAQVRNPQSVARAPAFLVAAYALLLWSSIRVFGDRRTEAFERLPAWRNTEPARPSTRDLIRLLQQQAAQVNLNQMRN
ncbi:MAG: transposase [Candidatus Nanopelagicales bacterium]